MKSILFLAYELFVTYMTSLVVHGSKNIIKSKKYESRDESTKLKTNNEALYNGSLDDNSVSADIVDQASSYTDKNVEMKAINRQIKLIGKIESALKKIKDGTYGFCEETGEPIGIKRLMARPIATLCIAAQEKHEKNEKVYADN